MICELLASLLCLLWEVILLPMWRHGWEILGILLAFKAFLLIPRYNHFHKVWQVISFSQRRTGWMKNLPLPPHDKEIPYDPSVIGEIMGAAVHLPLLFPLSPSIWRAEQQLLTANGKLRELQAVLYVQARGRWAVSGRAWITEPEKLGLVYSQEEVDRLLGLWMNMYLGDAIPLPLPRCLNLRLQVFFANRHLTPAK